MYSMQIIFLLQILKRAFILNINDIAFAKAFQNQQKILIKC